MAQLEISVTGPGLEIRRTLDEGQSVLIGRDTDCDLCLPDPERTVSRQHLAIWVEAGRLQLRVLSVVNGVDLPSGEVPPGGVATLAENERLMVGDYGLTVRQVVPDASAQDSVAPDASASGIVGLGAHGAPGAPGDEDPFGEWGFDATVVHRFVPQPAGQPEFTRTVAVGEAMTGDMAHFFKGLGLDAERLGTLNAAELESAGRKVRLAVEGLVALYAAKLDLSREMGADERTMVATRENNPLKTDWPLDTKLEYLLGASPAGAAFAQPEAALADLVAELQIHDAAVTAASRAVLEGALREFAPDKLEARIADDKSQGLLAKIRPWDAYAKYYAAESGRMAQWLERLFNRYFTAAYTRETTRIRKGATRRE